MTDESTSPQEDDLIDPIDQLLVAYLVAGATHGEAAAAIGRQAKFVQRRLHDPEFRASLSEARAERVSRAQDRLDGLFERAATVIESNLDSEVPAIALRAASMAITTGLRLRTAARQEGEILHLRQEIAAIRSELERRGDS